MADVVIRPLYQPTALCKLFHRWSWLRFKDRGTTKVYCYKCNKDWTQYGAAGSRDRDYPEDEID